MNTEQNTTQNAPAPVAGTAAAPVPPTTGREIAPPETAVNPADTSVDQQEVSIKRRTLAEKLAALEASKAQLAKRAAALTKEARRERNGQLIVWGIMSELTYQKSGAATRQRIKPPPPVCSKAVTLPAPLRVLRGWMGR